MFNPMRHRIPILKRLVPSLRKRLARARAHNGFALRASNGAVFLLNSENFVDRQIAFYDDFETKQTAYMFDQMQHHGCDLFIDVGANIGFYAIQVALRGLAPEILAFEPDERNRLQLGANILINRLVGEITILQQAVSSAAGTVVFRPGSETSTGQSRVSRASESNPEGTIALPCVSLDDVVTGTGKRIFIKMDIEGHEHTAIRGMRTCVARHKIFLQVESFASHVDDVKQELDAMAMRHLATIDDDHYFTNF